jgi:hypothetical protein
VVDDPDLLELLEAGRIGELLSLQTLDTLMEEGVLVRTLSKRMLRRLQQQGILREPVQLKEKRLLLPDGNTVVNDLEDRAFLLAALESVDYVVPFTEDTP